MTTVSDPAFACKNVTDCNTLNDVMDVIGANNYKTVSIQEHIGDRIRNAASGHYGPEFAYKLDDVIGSLSHQFDNHRGVIAPTGETWINSDTYDLLQPREVTEVFQPVLDQFSGYTFKRAGYLQGGRRLFIEVTLGKFEIARRDRKVGDVLEKNVTLFTGFDGSAATDIAESLLRLWCSNGCSSWVKQLSIRCKHTSNQRNRLNAAIAHLTDSTNVFQQISAKLNNYAQTTLDRQTAMKAIEKILPGDATRTTNKRIEILNEFHNEKRGTFGDTVFDLFNAFTAHASHETNYRTTETASREENRFNALNLDGRRSMESIVDMLDSLAS